MVLRRYCESGRCGKGPGAASALFFFLIAASLLLSGAYADAPSMPPGYRLEPSPEVSILAAGPESPGAESLLDAAILFSGAVTSRAGEAKERGLDAVAKARDLAVSEPDAYARGRIVLDMVHAIISSYSELETRLDAALLDGRYNCVGSSTLYAILARAAGLDVRGVILPDHAYCYLVVDGRRVDVETTVPDGYDATVHRLVSGSAKGVETGLRGVAALALRNRATLLERAGRWPEALALAVDAYAYVSGGLAGGDRADRFTWDTLAGRVNNAAAGLLTAGRHAEALAVVDRAIGLYGAVDGFIELRKAARTGSLAGALRKASPAGALVLADEALLAGDIGADVLESAFAYAYTALAEERRRAGDHLGAWEVAIGAQRRFPGSADLASLAGTARANWVISVHNRFAALYNAGRYAEAIAVVEGALELVPGERRLVDDLAAARKALP
jgi:tetratricopeptide (TPR) repeat protein